LETSVSEQLPLKNNKKRGFCQKIRVFWETCSTTNRVIEQVQLNKETIKAVEKMFISPLIASLSMNAAVCRIVPNLCKQAVDLVY
jgi:hypothetical protein